MVNLTALNNITGPTLNTTIISNAEEIIPNMITNANNTSDGFWSTLVLISTFIVILYLLYRDDAEVRMDIPTSILIASGFTTIIGIVSLVSGIASDVRPTIWFFVIFIIDLIGVYIIKSKGQI